LRTRTAKKLQSNQLTRDPRGQEGGGGESYKDNLLRRERGHQEAQRANGRARNLTKFVGQIAKS